MFTITIPATDLYDLHLSQIELLERRAWSALVSQEAGAESDEIVLNKFAMLEEPTIFWDSNAVKGWTRKQRRSLNSDK